MNMSKETREHLSCLVDGEINRETGRFLIRRLGTDEELRATWTRYHLVRDCLRHQDGGIAEEDLCARVNLALENQTPLTPSRRLGTSWLKPAAGLAIAASVALMAIVTVGPGVPGTPETGGDLAGKAAAEPFTSPQSLGQSAAPFSSQVSLSGATKLDSFFVRHYQAADSTGGKGFVRFVPIVITGGESSSESSLQDKEAENTADRNEEPSQQ
jgi:sigma-E factor negative regulatory protein RseA